MVGTVPIARRIAARTIVGVEHVPGLGPCWEWNGAHNDAGYALTFVGSAPQRRLRVHRLVYESEHGPIAPGMRIDHRCFNHGCVRGAHLRELTHAQNNENRSGAQQNSRTRVRGVTFSRNRFVVQVCLHGTRHYGGVFMTLDDANMAAIELRSRVGMTS